jgi:hypothetical protein
MFKIILLITTLLFYLFPITVNAAASPINPIINPAPGNSPSPVPLVGQILNKDSFVPNFPIKTTIGGFVSELYQVAFLIATFVALYWLAWGVFEYIFAGGDKQKLSSARGRITWAIVGLVFVLLAFLIAQYGAQIILPTGSNQPASTLPIFKK